ncbi:MAG TPA: phosphate-starvation-inducible PsiE family protein [Streptosporangiaceae bacterium]|nr:phosphate-starvation-inducible PsiE family protein [Streptosporangiaceae bacterium]
MPDPADGGAAKPDRPRGVAGTIWALEHAQDFVTVAVGVVLIALAAVLVVAGLANFFRTVRHSVHLIPTAAISLLDQVLLVLILVEIVHTVVLSLRAHRLAAQPFIIVGLVAVIRRILFVLSSEVKVNTTELGLLIAMLIAFVASFIAVSWFEKGEDRG